MGRKLQAVEVVTAEGAARHVLPERVEAALGELVGAAQEGLLALSVGVGLGVLAELMEEEVVDVVGPRSKPDPARSAYRHGRGPGEVTLGGRVLPVERPRARRSRVASRNARAGRSWCNKRTKCCNTRCTVLCSAHECYPRLHPA